MRILIDIGHPAHVHLFRNLYFKLINNGHFVQVTIKDIPIAKILLEKYRIPYIVIGKKSDGILGKFFDQIKFGITLYKIARKNKIDIAIGTSITIAHISKFSKITSFVFDDDDSSVQPLMSKFGHPFADYLVSPDVLNYERLKSNHITYPGYHELAYLHPKVFTPNQEILNEIGVKKDEPYFILRFNAFKAHHDIGISGLNIEQKRYLVNTLTKYGKVFITTERDIDEEFKIFQLKVSPEKAHSLLYFATLLIGDSQTMTSEAAVLGTPSLRCNSFAGKISYLEEEEKKYHLTYAFLPAEFENLKHKLNEMLSNKDLKKEWQIKRKAMLNDKINVTEFFYHLISNFFITKSIEKTKFDFKKFN
jgi:predicted glycosyltransferase